MSFQTDVNPNAPVTTFASLISTIHASVPKQVVDAGGTWKCSSAAAVTRNSKDCFQFRYFLPNGTESDIYVYYNRLLLGAADYPVFYAWENLPFKDIASTEQGLVSANGAWLSVAAFYVSYPGTSVVSTTYVKDSISWALVASATPQPQYVINPGIKQYSASWAKKFTDKDANVASGPESETNSTDITPSYNTVAPGQNSTFQNDFNDGISRITDDFAPPPSGDNIAKSLDEMEATHGEIRDDLHEIKGQGETGFGVPAKLEEIRSNLFDINAQLQDLPQKTADALYGRNFDGTGLTIGDHVAEINTHLASIAASASGPIPNATSDAGDKAKAGAEDLKTAIAPLLANISTGMAAVIAAIAAGAAGIAQSTTAAGEATAAAETAGAATVAEAVTGAAATEAAATAGVASAVTVAGVAEAAATAEVAAATGETALALTSTLPTVIAAGLSPLGAALVAGGTIYGILTIIHDLVETVKALKDIASDGKLDVKGDLKQMLEDIKNCICEGLGDEDGPFLLRQLEALGELDPDADDPPPESVRAFLRSLIEMKSALYITNETTGAKISISQLISMFRIIVRNFKGDKVFEFGG